MKPTNKINMFLPLTSMDSYFVLGMAIVKEREMDIYAYEMDDIPPIMVSYTNRPETPTMINLESVTGIEWHTIFRHLEMRHPSPSLVPGSFNDNDYRYKVTSSFHYYLTESLNYLTETQDHKGFIDRVVDMLKATEALFKDDFLRIQQHPTLTEALFAGFIIHCNRNGISLRPLQDLSFFMAYLCEIKKSGFLDSIQEHLQSAQQTEKFWLKPDFDMDSLLEDLPNLVAV